MCSSQKSSLRSFYQSKFFDRISVGDKKLKKIKENFLANEENKDENNIIYQFHNKYKNKLDVRSYEDKLKSSIIKSDENYKYGETGEKTIKILDSNGRPMVRP